MQKLLVTGGAGFIGSNLVRMLIEQTEYTVVNLDKLTYAGNHHNVADLVDHPRYSFVQGDVADGKFIDELFAREKFDGVLHLAAETHVDRSIADSGPFIDTNIIGTHVLLEAARAHGVRRYHQVSTDEVYGDLGDTTGTYFTEATPLSPHCPYAAAKASADLLVQTWHHTYGLDTVITRCSNNYGPYQYPEKLIPFFLFRAMRSEPLPLYGDGLNIRDWLYVADHCQAILTVFERSPAGEVWNIGGNNEKTNKEVAELIVASVPGTTSEITYVTDRAAHDRRYAIDATKLRTELGWEPAHKVEDALPKTIEWYLQNPDWVALSLQQP